MSETRKSTRKIENSTFANQAAVPAIPTNPKMPARIAMIRKISAHESIGNLLGCRSDRSPSLDDSDQNYDNGQYQEQVNESRHGIGAHHTE